MFSNFDVLKVTIALPGSQETEGSYYATLCANTIDALFDKYYHEWYKHLEAKHSSYITAIAMTTFTCIAWGHLHTKTVGLTAETA